MASKGLWRMRMGILILLSAAWGCMESDDGSPADAGGGRADAGPEQADAGSDAAPPPPPPGREPTLVEQLVACGAVETPCRWTESSAREGGQFDNVTAGEAICLLESVRDRRPGRYVNRLIDRHAEGDDTFLDVAVIHADGSISFAWGTGPLFEEELLPGDEGSAECETPPAAWFDACIERLRPFVGRGGVGSPFPDELAACLRIDGNARRRSAVDPPWLSDCVPAAPRCE